MFENLRLDFSNYKLKHSLFLFGALIFILAGFFKSIILGTILLFSFIALLLWAFLTTHNVDIKISTREE